ncbi:MAG TPA: zf-TFIIB domain-containing protein [Anaerolineales bacterium]|nr:zf-TFIIB domain-containing protein [Anaerolineales bacterium]
MKCPVDGSSLESRAVESVQVEACVRCRGLWFQGEELRKAKDAAQPDLNWLDFDLWSEQDSFAVAWSVRTCPQCGEKMAGIAYGTTGVTVDYCPTGHGIWLDNGEFENILNALDQEAGRKDTSEYIAASLKEAKELLIGNEGLPSDWKDLLSVTRLLEYRILAENPKVAELLLALQTASPFK